MFHLWKHDVSYEGYVPTLTEAATEQAVSSSNTSDL
jgi:hypothetical protein